MVIRDQVILYAKPGALPEGSLEQLIGQAREVDMAEVKAGITAKQTEEASAEEASAEEASAEEANADADA